MVTKNYKQINVRNAGDAPDTTATILIQNKVKKTPRVSVIIPVYNVEKYLRECLDSVVNQTLREIEIICVDDGSTDSSLDILKEYAATDTRITVITQQNLYAGVARNAGLAVARGKYVHFLDGDDFVESDVLKQLCDIMDETGPDFMKFQNYVYDCNSNQDTKTDYFSISFLPHDKFNTILQEKDKPGLINLPDTPWSGLYNLKFINDNGIRFDSLQHCNDVSFFIRAFIHAKTIYVSDKTYVHYRINRSGSLIQNRKYNFDSQIKLFYNAQQILSNADTKLKNLFLSHLISAVFYRFKSYVNTSDTELKQKLFQQVSVFLQNIPTDLLKTDRVKKLVKEFKVAENINNFEKTRRHKWFYKERRDNGERRIYLFGIRVFSYKKGCIKRAWEYPIRVYDKYHRLKDKIREIKKGK